MNLISKCQDCNGSGFEYCHPHPEDCNTCYGCGLAEWEEYYKMKSKIQLILLAIIICTCTFLTISCVPAESQEDKYNDNKNYHANIFDKITYHHDPHNKEICYAIVKHYKGVGITTVPCEKISPEKLNPITK